MLLFHFLPSSSSSSHLHSSHWQCVGNWLGQTTSAHQTHQTSTSNHISNNIPKIIIGLAQLASLWMSPESWCPKDGFQAWSKATYCLPQSKMLDKEPIWSGRRLSSLRSCLFLPLRHPSGLSSSPLPLTCFWPLWCALAIPLLLVLSRLVLLGRTILSCRRHTFWR